MEDLTKMSVPLLLEQEGFDTLELSEKWQIEHQSLVDVMKSLSALNLIQFQQKQTERWVLTEEGQQIAENKSPEAIVFNPYHTASV